MVSKFTTRELTIIGLLTALVTVSTMIVKIPILATQGYIHMGDSMIFLAAILFGRKRGAIAGGTGSALADLLLGYNHWILPTLIIKGLMGYIAGSIAEQENERLFCFKNVLALSIGALWMAVGYFIASTFIYGFEAAKVAFISDAIQGFGGAALFIPIGIALKRTKYFKRYDVK